MLEIYGAGLTYAAADVAFFLLKEKTAVIYIGDQGDGLGKVDVHGLVLGYLLVEGIGIFHRTIFDTGGTARAFFLNDVTGLLFQGDRKVTGFPFNLINFSERQNFYVWMPADLDQFR